MSQSGSNEGVIISGHADIKGDVVALGSGARASKIVNQAGKPLEAADLREIRNRIEELKSALAAHSGHLANRDDVQSSVETVETELNKQKPNKLTVTALLSGIASAVTSVTGIATAAEALKAVVTRLL